MADGLTCPGCGSGRVQKSSAIVEQGTRHTTGRSQGLGISSNGKMRAYGSRFEATTKAAHVAKNSAPGDSRVIIGLLYGIGAAIGVMILCVLIYGPLGFVFAFPLVIVVTLVSLFVAFQASIKPEDAQAAQNYAIQWYCKACGTLFYYHEGRSSTSPPHTSTQT